MNLTREEVRQKYSKIAGIYCWTNMHTLKKYIGQSSDIYDRYCKHLQKGGCSPRFHSSVICHGGKEKMLENFSFEILEVCEVRDLEKKEIEYQLFYNSLHPKGYNLIIGGNKTRKSIPFHKTRIKAEITRERLTISGKVRKPTPETLALLSSSHIGQDVCNRRPITATNEESTLEFESLRAAAKYFKTCDKQIDRVLKSKKIYKNYFLSYKNGIKSPNVYVTAFNDKESICFNSLSSAAKKLGCNRCGIKKAIELKHRYYNYFWKFTE